MIRKSSFGVAVLVAVLMAPLSAVPQEEAGVTEGANPAGAITDVPGIRVGQYTYPDANTGCTVVIADGGAVGGVDVRGGAPGTVETDLKGCRELEIARTGTFRGDVDVEVADVAGILEGTLIARELLLLRAGGSVRGNIAYGEIAVERGAAIVGDMRPLSEKGPPDAGRSSTH